MSLISKQDLISAAGLQKLGFLKNVAAGAIMKLTKIDDINVMYEKLRHLEGKDFFEGFVQYRNLKYIVYEEDLAKIPKTGPFIVVSNHPLGAIDGILMIKVIMDIRPDFKVMGNFLLTKIKPMEPYVISVNPFEDRKDAYSSATGMRGALQYLQSGGGLGIFPAGEVSNTNNEYSEILDREWEKPALKLIKRAKVPVVPMYFHAKNSSLFYKVSKIHMDLQTLLLPAEMMYKREKPIRIRIGKAISLKVMDDHDDIDDFGQFLRKKVYRLKSYYDKRKSLADVLGLRNLALKFPILKSGNVVQNIIDETPQADLIEDISKLKDKMLFNNGNYELYFTKYEDIPSIMREIGRQRELTFRAVGEGSNMPFDLDRYDKYYRHLFLWDNVDKRLVGAYRMGLGSEIMKKYGIDGFYTASLFEFDLELQPFFKKVIEMGRAYISQEYQQKPLPLFLLWRGIVHVCLRHPEHKFLMGGVSISDKFSEFSKSLMIEFMRSHYFDAAVAQYVHPKNEFKIVLKERDKNLFLEELDANLNKLDKIIDDLEPQMRLPVLIKKYIKQNAKVIAFNVDPTFNDAIDGLMYIRISDIPESTIKPVLEEMSEHYRREQDNIETENQ